MKMPIAKKLQLAAARGDRYEDVHAFVGGTGAVGGSALLQMLSMYDDIIGIGAPVHDRRPLLLATGQGSDDIKSFTGRLFKFSESRWGSGNQPTSKPGAGYVTPCGVEVALKRFKLTILGELEPILELPEDERMKLVRQALGNEKKKRPNLANLIDAVERSRPICTFLERYSQERAAARFRSVVIGIPIPSLIAYQMRHLKVAAAVLGDAGPEGAAALNDAVVVAFKEDLKELAATIAETVLIAHTTGVGGMYDEDDEGSISIRLAFAHSAQDQNLADKQRFAADLADEYAKIGVKVLITAAAIGIDEIRIRSNVPLHSRPVQLIGQSQRRVFKGKAKDEGGARKDRPLPARFACLVQPTSFPLDTSESKAIEFDWGKPIRPYYSIRSGENGFFSVANADALYRVMRVASASELGLLLATVGLFGDDPRSPWFEDNICYYNETDNSRQVFDLLNQPKLLQMQLSGLEPMALQDLGSSKHQGELHTLGLLILLHRLITLDIDAIDPYTDVERFDPAAFFVEHSRVLTFDDLCSWRLRDLVADINVLASARKPGDLRSIKSNRDRDRFPMKDAAVRLVLQRVIDAVWMAPSLGSPIITEVKGKCVVRSGFYMAPLEALVTNEADFHDVLVERHRESGNPCTFEDFRDFNICTGGFVDLRQGAILCTARTDAEDLRGKVIRCADEAQLRTELRRLRPYTMFTTSGLTALTFRLRALGEILGEAMIELGTLHDFRWQMPRDVNGHILLVPGAVEAFRMLSEGLGKTTGMEYLDGFWGYERRASPDVTERLKRT